MLFYTHTLAKAATSADDHPSSPVYGPSADKALSKMQTTAPVDKTTQQVAATPDGQSEGPLPAAVSTILPQWAPGGSELEQTAPHAGMRGGALAETTTPPMHTTEQSSTALSSAVAPERRDPT